MWPFLRWHFQMDFLEWKCINFDKTFIGVFVLGGPISNRPALVQIMAWRRPGDKPLSEPMMASLLTHICVTRSQWVNISVESVDVSYSDWGDFSSRHVGTPSMNLVWFRSTITSLFSCDHVQDRRQTRSPMKVHWRWITSWDFNWDRPGYWFFAEIINLISQRGFSCDGVDYEYQDLVSCTWNAHYLPSFIRTTSTWHISITWDISSALVVDEN